MRERRHILRPIVEGLEAKALLSGVIAGSSAAAVVTPPIMRVIHLNGTVRGHYHVNNPIPDVGTTYVTNGSGHVHGVGHAFLTGKLHSVGFIAQGHAQGDLFLAGANGTITLRLTGPQQGGFRPLPDIFHYSVVGGTGKYSNITDSGTATLVTIPENSQANPQALEHGTFTLVLTSAPKLS